MFKARLAALQCCTLAGLLMSGCQAELGAKLATAEALMFAHDHAAAEATLAPAVAGWRSRHLVGTAPPKQPASHRVAVAAHRRLAELYALYLEMPERALEVLEGLAALAPASEVDAARWQAAQLMRSGSAEPGLRLRALADIAASGVSPYRRAACLALLSQHLGGGDIAAAEGIGAALLAEAEQGTDDLAAACRALAQVAEAHLGAGRPEAAVALYSALVDRLPEGPLAAQMRFQLGCARQHLGADDPALVAFLAALPHHPSPKLVAEKIERVRQRLAHTHPTGKILTASGHQTFADAASRRPRAARPRG